jgi:hypothetical protein
MDGTEENFLKMHKSSEKISDRICTLFRAGPGRLWKFPMECSSLPSQDLKSNRGSCKTQMSFARASHQCGLFLPFRASYMKW